MKKGIAFILTSIALLMSAGCLRVVVHGDPNQAAEHFPEQVVRALKAAMPPVRVATYNVSLHGDAAGALIKRLEKGDLNAKKIAAVIQTVRPDIILLNEFDYDAAGRAADIFQRRYLEKSQFGEAAIVYPYRYFAPVNTGVASGLDLDRDGTIAQSGRAYGNDALGFGLYPGQYGMLVLSRFPIDDKGVRSFKNLKWSTIPGSQAPRDPISNQSWYSEAAWKRLPLSSKSHWDVPILTPQGELHVLASHPTPPSFDGPENRNGLRNAAEIQLWNAYISTPNAAWLCDDGGHCGGLQAGDSFVILGDLNADAADGEGLHDAIGRLLDNPRLTRQLVAPQSFGAQEAAKKYKHSRLGNAQAHTADFGPQVGTLRVDYVLPSSDFAVRNAGVFWPALSDPKSKWISASDHHLVWLDIRTQATR